MLCLHSPYPAIGPRARSTRLAGRRALAWRTSALRKRPLPLSCVATRCHDPRPSPDAPDAASGGSEKRDVVCMWAVGTFVLLPGGTIDARTQRNTIQLSMYNRSMIAQMFAFVNKKSKGASPPLLQTRNGFSSPAWKDGGFQARFSVTLRGRSP